MPNSRTTYGCDTPAARATSSVLAAYPRSANTLRAATRISARRWVPDMRGVGFFAVQSTGCS